MDDSDTEAPEDPIARLEAQQAAEQSHYSAPEDSEEQEEPQQAAGG
jgi:hypothetical protein